MISGKFNRKGELIFEIGLIATDETVMSVKAILDTGFTGWLIINNQDARRLGWYQTSERRRLQTVGGKTDSNVYEGIVLIDDEEWIIRVLGVDDIENILLGVRWLQIKRLVADFTAGVLTLG